MIERDTASRSAWGELERVGASILLPILLVFPVLLGLGFLVELIGPSGDWIFSLIVVALVVAGFLTGGMLPGNRAAPWIAASPSVLMGLLMVVSLLSILDDQVYWDENQPYSAEEQWWNTRPEIGFFDVASIPFFLVIVPVGVFLAGRLGRRLARAWSSSRSRRVRAGDRGRL